MEPTLPSESSFRFLFFIGDMITASLLVFLVIRSNELQIIQDFFFYSIASGCYGEFPRGANPRKLGRQLWVNENVCFSLLLYSVLSSTFLCRCTGSFAKIIKSLLLGKYTQERLVREFRLYECNYSSPVPSTLGDWCNVNFVISTTS